MLQRGYGKDCKSMKKWQESNKDENMKLFVTAFSKKAKMRYCRSFNEESRTNIVTHFWKMTWDMKKETYLVQQLLIKVPNENKSDNDLNRKAFTYDYYLFKGNLRL